MKLVNTRKGQMLSVLITHTEMSFLSFMLWLFTVGINETKIGGTILTILSVLIYVIVMYSQAYGIEKKDARSFSKITPKWYNGFYLAVFVTAINLIIVLLYPFVWKLAGGEDGLSSIWAVLVNMLSVFWLSPYQKLVYMEKGTISLISYLYIFCVPVLLCFLGYLAGYKKIDIGKKLHDLSYEKKGE